LHAPVHCSRYLLARLLTALLVAGTIAVFWRASIAVFQPGAFLLPTPERVVAAAAANSGYLARNAMVTLGEMLAGLAVGAIAGAAVAILMARSAVVERLALPVIVTTQTLPVFAIAPLLVIWFGFGAGSKIVMATLIIFFPVASSFFDGLRRVNRDWLDLAQSWGATPALRMQKIQIPAALPSLASGLKIAATLAPIGAIVGEWAGASAGLGYVMLQANARMQTDMVFACVIILALLAWLLRAIVASILDRLVFWQGR
jgi:putative hydroxymethylpyrimidine transport system permease protein